MKVHEFKRSVIDTDLVTTLLEIARFLYAYGMSFLRLPFLFDKIFYCFIVNEINV
jgi:hypothetical protein